jgi:predicted DCC family thiol-disulfide oxidoreductase YuxK
MMRSDAHHVLIFDGACPMCVRWMGRVRHWDEHDSFEYVPLQDPSVPHRFPELDPDALATAMHLVGPDGEVWSGAAAVERILDLLPLGRWLGWLFRLPFARPIADRVYRRVAENRSRLGCGSHCGLWTGDSSY